jgi:hypothetical protein
LDNNDDDDDDGLVTLVGSDVVVVVVVVHVVDDVDVDVMMDGGTRKVHTTRKTILKNKDKDIENFQFTGKHDSNVVLFREEDGDDDDDDDDDDVTIAFISSCQYFRVICLCPFLTSLRHEVTNLYHNPFVPSTLSSLIDDAHYYCQVPMAGSCDYRKGHCMTSTTSNVTDHRRMAISNDPKMLHFPSRKTLAYNSIQPSLQYSPLLY